MQKAFIEILIAAMKDAAIEGKTCQFKSVIDAKKMEICKK